MEFDESLIVERIDDLNEFKAVEPEHLLTLHCLQCNTVLADSLGVCGELKCTDSIICLRVSDDVIVCEGLESIHKGEMANCICSHLKCRLCNCVVGNVIHAAPLHLAAVRSVFLLHKAKMSCYVLDSSSMVAASSLSFDQKPLGKTVKKARQAIEEQLAQMAHTCSRLADISISMSTQSTI